MTTSITPQVTRPPLPAAEHIMPRDNGGYGCHEVAKVTLGEFTGGVWRHLHRDRDGTWFKFDATIDGLVSASSDGLGDDPQRLRELASVAWATADELGKARATTKYTHRDRAPSDYPRPYVYPAQRTRSGRRRPDAARTGTRSSQPMCEYYTLDSSSTDEPRRGECPGQKCR